MNPEAHRSTRANLRNSSVSPIHSSTNSDPRYFDWMKGHNLYLCCKYIGCDQSLQNEARVVQPEND